ncbi:MAG: DUF1338 domain-containing protein [Planctomycetaceae bacterium]|nr:DUF1338 domain-containing protein [Planctomycetaceae bacterium]
MNATRSDSGPHRHVQVPSIREQFLVDLFDRLWDTYSQRVPYARQYEQLIAESGDTFWNDHIAFRCFACQQPCIGMVFLTRIFETLGYSVAGNYSFADKHLSAVHLQHTNPGLPKLFVSELRAWELDPAVAIIIRQLVSEAELTIEDQHLRELDCLETLGIEVRKMLLIRVLKFFQQVPWPAPDRLHLERLSQASQYAAWVSVHGFSVNHFTALINAHTTQALADIDRTANALRKAGVPMKPTIEGAVGSKLRQTSTESSIVKVPVRDKGQSIEIDWPYAYFELAERGSVTDQQSGRPGRFEGFLGAQATHLFEMTQTKERNDGGMTPP